MRTTPDVTYPNGSGRTTWVVTFTHMGNLPAVEEILADALTRAFGTTCGLVVTRRFPGGRKSG